MVLRFGISSASLYPEITEKAVEQLGEAGIKNTEVFINTTSELKPEFIDILNSLKQNYSMNILSIHPFSSVHEPFMIFTDYERRYADALESYKLYFEAMNRLDAKILVFHGDRRDSLFPDEKYFERFVGLKNLADSYGLILAQENVERCKSHNPQFLKKMKEQIPDVSFVLDIKQCRRSDVSPFDLIDIMGNNLVHVHLSDNDSENDCLPVGKGDFDIQELFTKLKQMNYNGGVLLELYRRNFSDLTDLLESHRKTVEIYNNCRI